MENKSDYFRFGGNVAQIQQIVSFFTQAIIKISNKGSSYVMNFGIKGQLWPGAKTNKLKT